VLYGRLSTRATTRIDTPRRVGRWAAACIAAGAGTLALPSVAAAHGRAATVALDYRLTIDSVGRSTGIKAAIVDGDRSLRLGVGRDMHVVVLGDLGEPMLRLDGGVWVNQDSPTAQANRLVRKPKTGWKQLTHGRQFAWHEHRLAPPPFQPGRYGVVAHWQVPLLVDGHRTTISGSFWRVHRPSAWPWLLAAFAVVGLSVVAFRALPRIRVAATTCAGILAGITGLTAQTAFALRDAPSGNIGWALIVAAFAVAAVAAGALVVARGTERAYLAGAVGVCVAVFCLSWLGVFFHGAVISALPADAVRLVCSVAFTAGLVSLLGVLLLDVPERVRTR
jgi:FtsH-binding integral membrane protein